MPHAAGEALEAAHDTGAWQAESDGDDQGEGMRQVLSALVQRSIVHERALFLQTVMQTAGDLAEGMPDARRMRDRDRPLSAQQPAAGHVVPCTPEGTGGAHAGPSRPASREVKGARRGALTNARLAFDKQGRLHADASLVKQLQVRVAYRSDCLLYVAWMAELRYSKLTAYVSCRISCGLPECQCGSQAATMCTWMLLPEHAADPAPSSMAGCSTTATAVAVCAPATGRCPLCGCHRHLRSL